ncbi:DOMON domain-containing protein [Tunicatimonas pelagia]|uniref:DOMON domain-containing protein n=1 Tax=Tunicatimonas pelagia TaxID=931531 RepID=UPI0026657EEA|nr:DOMON domain-containing protein [Tunicatimonas pelagia]WKN44533.1 DOMON domain-containing protein [Tunicatimonas pelagia]
MLSLLFFLQGLLGWSVNPELAATNNPVTVSNITFQYRLHADSLEIQVSAPTHGWVAVGFHNDAKLIGNDLLMFSVIDGMVVYQEYIRNWNDHPEDTALGGENSIDVIGYLEDETSTTVKFKIPINSGDSFDTIHQPNRDFYLLLAYSVEDDFNHHSMVRKQIPYRFIP